MRVAFWIILLFFITAPYTHAKIIITEFMPNPDADGTVSDSKGEWFEVYNDSDSDIDLSSWTIKDEGSNSHKISTSVIIPSKSYKVLCKDEDSNLNGGVTCVYEYSSFTLANSEDEVVLLDGSDSEMDRVGYSSSWPYSTGVSAELKDLTADNGNVDNWQSGSEIFGSGDKGTPGKANSQQAEESSQTEESSQDSSKTTSEDSSSQSKAQTSDPDINFEIPESISLGDSFDVKVTLDGTSDEHYVKFMADNGSAWNDGFTWGGSSWLSYTSTWADFPKTFSETTLLSKTSFVSGEYKVKIRARNIDTNKNYDSEEKTLRVVESVQPVISNSSNNESSGNEVLAKSDVNYKIPKSFRVFSWESTLSAQAEDKGEPGGSEEESEKRINKKSISVAVVGVLVLGMIIFKKLLPSRF